MAVKKSKPITKSAAIEKTLDSSITNLNNALNQAEKAIKLRQAESKKLLNESRKLKKRRLTQIGKKKRAAAAVKKNANATTNKALRTLTAELNATKKALDKAHTLRQVVLSELSGLKASHKKLVGYIKGIQATDKLIARPKKKKRAKKKVITFVAPDPMPVAPDPMPVAPDPMPVAPDPMPVASDTTPDASDTTPDASDTMPDASDTMPDASDTMPDASDTMPDAS